MFNCEHCHAQFSDRSNKNRHQRTFCKNRPKKIKIVVNVKKKENSIYQQLRKELDDVSKEINEIKNSKELITQPIINVNINNYMVITDDIYGKLVDKMGKDSAIRFLATNASRGDCVSILRKLYLEGIPRKLYPIACKDNNFRYLNDRREIVEDIGGKKIVSNLQNAMLYASTQLIKEHIDSTNTDQLYELYDMGKIQEYIHSMCHAKVVQKICNDISNEIQNPDHPYFLI